MMIKVHSNEILVISETLGYVLEIKTSRGQEASTETDWQQEDGWINH